MDEATVNALLQSTTAGGDASSLLNMDALLQSLAPFFLAMTLVSALLVVLYLISIISKWRANKAIIDIKKLLVEMNERDKARHPAPVSPTTPPATSSAHLAASSVENTQASHV